MSLRALDETLKGKLNGLYHLVGLRSMNNLLIRLAPEWWYDYKRKVARKRAERVLEAAG
jgi:hypothetical protein